MAKLRLLVASLMLAYNPTVTSATSDTLEIIEVTSQKRIQPVQEIPISITALSADTLETANITQASEIASLIPNVNTTRSISGISNYYIRGVGMDGFNLTAIPAVGLYVDDVAIINPMLANFALYDINRVEVLKGPQNTLYGKNTTAGAINFISNNTNDDELNGYGQITLGSHEQKFLNAAVASKLTEKLNIRLAAFSHNRDGLISSEIKGNDTKFNNINQDGIRLKLAYLFTENIEIQASLYGGKQNQIAEVKSAISPLNNMDIINLNNHDLSKNYSSMVNPINDIDALGGYFKVKVSQENYLINVISSFEKVKTARTDDWGSQHLPSSVFQTTTYNSTDTKSFSQEVQLQSVVSKQIQWIVGLLYSHEDGDLLQTALIDPAGPGRPDDEIEDAGIGPMFDRGAWVEHKNKTTSLYAQLSTPLLENLNFSAGLRWTNQNLTPTVNSAGMMMDLVGQEFPLGSLGWYSLGNNNFNRLSDHMGFEGVNRFLKVSSGFPASAKIDDSFNQWGGKLSLDYKLTPQTMVYANLSRGFKMGSVNSNPTSTAYQSLLSKIVEPETLVTSELGVKSTVFNKKVRINASVFNNQWENYQFFLVHNPGNPADLFASLVNLPEAKSTGAEFDLAWQLSSSLRFNVGVAWLDSKVTNANLDTQGIPEQNKASFLEQVQVGNKLTNAPEWSYHLSAHKTYELDTGDLDFNLHYSYLGEHIHQLAGKHSQTWIKNFSEKAIGLLSVNLLYSFGDNKEYQASLWAKNVTDKQYCSERAIAPGASPDNIRLCSQGDPKSLGITVKVMF
ncbi:TonB-dependent receptor [Paraglaciecola sp.]|uniref:TonB-dependent receptor n=1 Tax=Paraglaciecola sp. TaxID=1920173 RepID=UPI003EF3E488